MHLNTPWQDFVGGTLGIYGFEEFNIYLVFFGVGFAFEFQCGVLEVDGFFFDVCVQK
jgi:hypothetical protein